MTTMTIREYCELHKVAKTTLLFHLARLQLPPCGTVQVSKRRPSYIWERSSLDAARERIKFKMVEL